MSKKLILISLFISLSGCGSSVEKWECEEDGVVSGEVRIDLKNKAFTLGTPRGERVFEITHAIESENRILLEDKGDYFSFHLEYGRLTEELGFIQREPRVLLCKKI